MYRDTERAIQPMADCKEEQRHQAVRLLHDAFADALKTATATETADHVRANYCMAPADVMYVMTFANTGEVVGAVSIDRKNFYPCIGHLVVDPRWRRQGYGRMLLRFAEAHVRHQKFPAAFLWHAESEDGLAKFYKSCGYSRNPDDPSFVHPGGTLVYTKPIQF
jgi:GNAT superfamily N-acetyltransferase